MPGESVLWRFTYRQAEIDAGEAIVFAYPQGVELDGPRSLTYGSRALLEEEQVSPARFYRARG